METNNIDNPPAFPFNYMEDGIMRGLHRGMSLRDYYAGQALQGICAHGDTWGLNETQIAERCYSLADAMLKARQTTNKE